MLYSKPSLSNQIIARGFKGEVTLEAIPIQQMKAYLNPKMKKCYLIDVAAAFVFSFYYFLYL